MATQFKEARQRFALFSGIDDPEDVIVYLHGRLGELDDEDAMVAALVALAQTGANRDLGLHLVLLGLWPRLDAAFRLRSGRMGREQADVTAAMF